MGKTTMLSSARLLALVASTTFLAAVRAEKCANACYGESCDFWVREWGVSCSLVESEIGCSCAGCACENPDTFEKNIRSFGRRNGTGTRSSRCSYRCCHHHRPGHHHHLPRLRDHLQLQRRHWRLQGCVRGCLWRHPRHLHCLLQHLGHRLCCLGYCFHSPRHPLHHLHCDHLQC